MPYRTGDTVGSNGNNYYYFMALSEPCVYVYRTSGVTGLLTYLLTTVLRPIDFQAVQLQQSDDVPTFVHGITKDYYTVVTLTEAEFMLFCDKFIPILWEDKFAMIYPTNTRR